MAESLTFLSTLQLQHSELRCESLDMFWGQPEGDVNAAEVDERPIIAGGG